jgi:alpha-ketoglutarate-dependent taurine dioxygenase
MKPMQNEVVTLRDIANPWDLKDRLDAQGWLIIRNEVRSLEQFEQVSKLWFSQFHRSATRHDRNQSSPDGLSLQVRSSGHLLAHAEGYYRPCLPPPDVGLLWCKTAPKGAGGETSLFDGAAFFDALPTAIAERLDKEKVVYEFSWPKDRWSLEFSTSSAEQLANLLLINESVFFDFEADEHLHLHYHAQAVMEDNQGRKRFINGLLAHLPSVTHPSYVGNVFTRPQNRVFWQDMTPWDSADINSIIDAHDRVMQRHRWQEGDLLIINNHTHLHGRVALAAPEPREIFSRFAYSQQTEA